VEALELPVWTSSEIASAKQDQDNKWHLTVKRGQGAERKLIVNHLVFATGLAGGSYKSFQYPGLVSGPTSAITSDSYAPRIVSYRINSKDNIFTLFNINEH